MTDRVHPAGFAANDLGATEPLNPSPRARPDQDPLPPPPPPSFVIQVPKDQVYRQPPPENAYRMKRFMERAERRRRGGCCFYLCWILAALLFLAFLLGVAAAVLYLVFRPKLPIYTLDSLSVRGFDVLNTSSSSATPFSPEFVAVVRAENPNTKISIDYRQGSSIKLYYSATELAAGTWPAFRQGRTNLTAVRVAMKGPGILPSDTMRSDIAAAQKKKAVPLRLAIRMPVRVLFGQVRTWTVTVKARCDVTVDGLTPTAKVMANACGAVKVNIF